MVMTSSSSATSTTSPNVFDIGKYETLLFKVGEETCTSKSSLSVPPPPKPLLIATPSEEGEFPLLLFLHGYLLYNSFYSKLIKQIASHGFIVVAPQLYTVAGPDSTEEIQSSAEVTNWLSKGLQSVLPSHVQANLNKMGLAGHSRGGKVAFALALKKGATSSKILAVIGVDPVDGMDKGKQTPPPVLTYVPRSFDLNMAALVIGSGLGEVKKNPLFPPCAPKGVNHEDFYNECTKPAYHFVAKDYGHLDMLDDDTNGVRGKATYCLCKNGKSRDPMRRFVGGLVVAFMKAYLEGDPSDLIGIRKRRVEAPLDIQKLEFLL